MANSLAKIYSQEILKLGGHDEKQANGLVHTKSVEGPKIQAHKFKYQELAAQSDISQVRSLILSERVRQSGEQFQFWTEDFERMMQDDWLVTRFLIRGKKASDRLGQASRGHHVETLELIKLCAQFRYNYRITPSTSESEFPIEWTSQNGLISHKTDFVGNPVIYFRICLHKQKLIEDPRLRHQFKRLVMYHFERCDQGLRNNLGKAICCVFDMSSATIDNIDLELVTWMVNSSKNCGPKLVSYVIVYNLPWFFSATFKLITRTLLSSANKQIIEFVYGDEILSYISKQNLPEYMRLKLRDKSKK